MTQERELFQFDKFKMKCSEAVGSLYSGKVLLNDSFEVRIVKIESDKISLNVHMYAHRAQVDEAIHSFWFFLLPH
jgi:hypothetical protein